MYDWHQWRFVLSQLSLHSHVLIYCIWPRPHSSLQSLIYSFGLPSPPPAHFFPTEAFLTFPYYWTPSLSRVSLCLVCCIWRTLPKLTWLCSETLLLKSIPKGSQGLVLPTLAMPPSQLSFSTSQILSTVIFRSGTNFAYKALDSYCIVRFITNTSVGYPQSIWFNKFCNKWIQKWCLAMRLY